MKILNPTLRKALSQSLTKPTQYAAVSLTLVAHAGAFAEGATSASSIYDDVPSDPITVNYHATQTGANTAVQLKPSSYVEEEGVLLYHPLSGSINVSSANDDTGSKSITALYLEYSSATRLLPLKDLTIMLGASDAPITDGSIYAITGKNNYPLDLLNTDITIHSHASKSGANLFGLSWGAGNLGLAPTIGTVDADSSIYIKDHSGKVARSVGILAETIENYHGTIVMDVNSGGNLHQSAGMRIFNGQATSTYAGSIEVRNANVASGLYLHGSAQTISSDISVDASSRGVGIVLLGDEGSVGTISSTVSINQSSSTAPTEHATGIAIEAGRVGTISSNVSVRGDGDYVYGITLYSNTYTDYLSSPSAGIIDSVVQVYSGNSSYSDRVAAVVSHLGTTVESTGHQTGFDELRGTIEATGTHNAVGLDLRAGYGIPDAENASRLNESGTIYAQISAITDETYVRYPDTPWENESTGESVAYLNGDRSVMHNKSTTAIRVDERLESFDDTLSESEFYEQTLYHGVNEAKVDVATLRFGNGASATARVGDSYGDAIAFGVRHLKLTTEHASDRVTLVGDITCVADSGNVKSGGNIDEVSMRYPDDPVGALVGERQLSFLQGDYDVSSDYWFVDRAALGDAGLSQTSQVVLHDSTSLVGTKGLEFHLSSVDNHSQLSIDSGHTMTVTELTELTLTLDAALMNTEEFRLTVIDGDMIDNMGGTLTVTLRDLIHEGTGGLADDLGSIYVEYDGKQLYSEDGIVSFTYDGTASDLVIGRGNAHDLIPEPSTTALSLLSLAPLLARRRRRREI